MAGIATGGSERPLRVDSGGSGEARVVTPGRQSITAPCGPPRPPARPSARSSRTRPLSSPPTRRTSLGIASPIGLGVRGHRLWQRDGNARQDLRAIEVAPVGNDIEALCLERFFRLPGQAGELRPVVADIGHLVRDDQMMLGVDGHRHVVAHNARAAAIATSPRKSPQNHIMPAVFTQLGPKAVVPHAEKDRASWVEGPPFLAACRVALCAESEPSLSLRVSQSHGLETALGIATIEWGPRLKPCLFMANGVGYEPRPGCRFTWPTRRLI
jgi:hypothetical protein